MPEDVLSVPGLPPTQSAGGEAAKILSRIYITEEGDLVVTDLWEDLENELVEGKGFERS